jgi:sugar-specific transcriptional regulator TrmB
MNPELLQTLGLSRTQAMAYLRLAENGALSPPKLAQLTGESRANTYMVLGRLEELGLVEKLKNKQKVTYQPLNPIALEQLAEQKQRQAAQTQQQIKQTMPQMLSYFYSFTEKPGIRLLQGIDGLKEIYADTLRTKQDIYFMRTPHEVEFMGEDYFIRYKKKRAELGIKTHALTVGPPDQSKMTEDKSYKMLRTWLDQEDYTAPVEINIYGDKVAYLVYGEEIMGVIVQSPAIAKSMRQIFKMLEKLKA